MQSQTPDVPGGQEAATPVRIAARLYRRALALLPPGMRAEFGGCMQDLFEDIARRAHARHGAAGVALAFLRAIIDVVGCARAERDYELRRAAALDMRRIHITTGERMLRIVNDLRIAARTLARQPGFSLVVVLTLALAIGANIAIFAVVNAVLIRPLPYPDPEGIVVVRHHAPGLGLPDLGNSPGSMHNYVTNARSFSAIAGVTGGRRNLTGSGQASELIVGEVTPSVFDVLRVQPLLGRRFVDADTAAGAPAVAILMHGTWLRNFGGTHDVIGTTVQLDRVATRIIGVMPEGFAYPDAETAALVPIEIDYADGYGAFSMTGIARLAPGVTLDAAGREVESLQKRIPELDEELTADFLERAGWGVSLETLRDATVKDAEKTLWVVLGTVSFLLLVACASVANLFLVRAESRRREVGVRFALGATRGRVASGFITESLILGVAGGAWGLLIAAGALQALLAAAPPELPRLADIGVDLRVILFGAAVSILAGVLFGVLPLPHRMTRPLADMVRGGRGQTDGRDRQLLRRTLIVAQIALALMLLVGSGLLLRSFQRLADVDPGFNADGVLTTGVSLGTVTDRAAAARTYLRMADEVAALPGVTGVAITNSLPIDVSGYNGGSFSRESRPTPDDELPPVAMYVAVSDGYFETMGTPLASGRDLTRYDVDHNAHVVLVNETFAKSFFDGDALDERIRFGEDTTWMTIVGIVKDVRTFGLKEDIRPMAYLPIGTHLPTVYHGHSYVIARTAGDPAALTAAVRQVVERIDPDVPVTNARTMREVLSKDTAQTSLTMTILALAASVSLLLSAVGLYGVIGYVVTQRTREIGVRIALGALPARIGTMVLRQGLVLAGVGIITGLIGAAALSRLLESVLFEVDSRDPLTFAAVPILLLIITSLASWLPARRAAAVSPMEALRSE